MGVPAMRYQDYENKIPEVFKSDGCTFAPDGSFRNCCRLHDFARLDPDVHDREADTMLFRCMWDKGGASRLLAPAYWAAVRVQGWVGFGLLGMALFALLITILVWATS